MNTINFTRRSFVQHLTVSTTALFVAPYWALGSENNASGTIRKAMDKAAKCCLAWLNPNQQFLPAGGYEVGHDTGRWWDAMLRYEASTGILIPKQAEDAMMQNLVMLTDNPAALLTSKLFNPHNLRETMLTYTALVNYRKSVWARVQGHKLIEIFISLIDTDGQLNYEKFAELAGKPLTKDSLMQQMSPHGQWFNSTGSTGRAIEAIILFYQATGDDSALKLSKRLSEIHLQNDINVNGKVRSELLDPKSIGHNHSYFGTLRGLLLYGFANGGEKYIEAIANTYRKGIWGTSISYSGWTPHDQGKIRFPDKEGDPVGEHASCGDVVQLALWLALRDGQTDLLDDVERLIRARLLPSQIDNPSDPRRDGAWGVYNHPFGRGAILDVFAAVLHSLTDVYQHIVTTAPDGNLSVNLHFDIDTSVVTVLSKRAENARLFVTPKQSVPLRIRVPAWASRESVRLYLGNKALPLHWDGPYLVVRKKHATAGKTIILQHDLPKMETVEEMPVSHRKFYLSWRGDEVIACEPKVEIYKANS